jgi:hypothetical protein
MTRPVFAFTFQPVAELTVHEAMTQLMRVQPVPKSRTHPHGHMSLILGGTVIAEAKAEGLDGGESWFARLQYHGGRRTWMVENERRSPKHIHPRDDVYGDLWKMMGWFQKLTGLQLPALKLVELGVGITEHTPSGSSASPGNPWQLEPGVYEFMRGGDRRRIEVLDERGKMVVRFVDGSGPSETFDPRLTLSKSGAAAASIDSRPAAESLRRPRP